MSINPIANNKLSTTQSEQAFYQNATSNELLVKKELDKIIDTKKAFVQKEDIIN